MWLGLDDCLESNLEVVCDVDQGLLKSWVMGVRERHVLPKGDEE